MNKLIESTDVQLKHVEQIKANTLDYLNKFRKSGNKSDIKVVIEDFPKDERLSVLFTIIDQLKWDIPHKSVRVLTDLGNKEYKSSKTDIFNALCIKTFREAEFRDISSLIGYGDTATTFATQYGEDLTGVKFKGRVNCWDGEMTSLKGAPAETRDDFDVQNNKLTSLKYAPTKVGGSFTCKRNNLTSMEGAPTEIGSGCWAEENPKLSSLKGLKNIKSSLVIEDCGFKSKEDIFEQIIKYGINVGFTISTDFGNFQMEDVLKWYKLKKIGKFKDFLDL